MDQIKIGNFIAAKRKEQSLTQRQLAEKIGISDKTVSKWECGNGMPEVSLMLPLCDILHITVNELLSGEMLSSAYQEKAEENLISMIKENESNKKNHKKTILTLGLSLVGAVLLWLILFADSNVYQLGDVPTTLTLIYLVAGFVAIYFVLAIVALGIMGKNISMVLAALSLAAFICLLICMCYQTTWLLLPSSAGMILCAALSLWSYFKHKHTCN